MYDRSLEHHRSNSKFSTWAQSSGHRNINRDRADHGRFLVRRNGSMSSAESGGKRSPIANGSIPLTVPPPPQLNGSDSSNIFLMVDPCLIPNTLGPEIRVFDLHDGESIGALFRIAANSLSSVVDVNVGTQHIVGYCIPMRCCVGLFTNIQPCRALKIVDSPLINEQFVRKYKFQSMPLNVTPMHDKEFHKMMKSPPQPFRNNACVQKNRFYVSSQAPTPGPDTRSQFGDDTAMHHVLDKFQLHMNPHLVAYRLPDGLDCYIRLELAHHCQHEFARDDQPLVHHHRHHQQHNYNQHNNYHCVRDNNFYEDEPTARKIGGGRQKIGSISK